MANRDGQSDLDRSGPSEAEIRKLLLRDADTESSDWLWQTDHARRIVNPTQRFADVCGVDRKSLLGAPILKVLAASNWEVGEFAPALREIAGHLKEMTPFRDLLLPIKTDDIEKWWEISGNPLFDENGKFTGFFGVASDVTAARESADRISRLARYDGVTGLPNQMLVNEMVVRTIAEAERYRTRVSVGIIAITNLNDVKSAIGYVGTEKLLAAVGQAINKKTLNECFIGQLSPGEYVAIWQGSFDSDLIGQVYSGIQRLAENTARKFGKVNFSRGSALYPDEAITSSELISLAMERVYPPLSVVEQARVVKDSALVANGTGLIGDQTKSDVQRQAILDHGPQAQAGLEILISEHRHRLHNGPPEALNEAELERLQQLNAELQNLILLAGEGAPVTKKASIVAGLVRRVFKFSKETGELFVAGLKPFLASAPLAIGTLVLLQAVCTPAIGSVLGPGAALAILAGHYGYDVKRKNKDREVD